MFMFMFNIMFIIIIVDCLIKAITVYQFIIYLKRFLLLFFLLILMNQ